MLCQAGCPNVENFVFCFFSTILSWTHC